ncbi:MAG: polyphosphate kinase 2 family protein [Candidatus Paceibacterota bacterium]|jgi:PPK2 family polyphosphate:nucleotide phosphotransferase
MKDVIRKARKSIKPFCVDGEKGFHLEDSDPSYAKGFDEKQKKAIEEEMNKMISMIGKLQERLYATNKFGILLIFQGMDTAGKDGVIKHVMSGVNPQGCQVFSFKAPSMEELEHDYLWRCNKRLPNRGQMGIFNRSYYEETLAVRVHPEFLDAQRLPNITKEIWQERFEDFRSYERYLNRNGIVVCKFFLNISKGEQKERLLARLDTPEKHWKFSERDIVERGFWKKYQKAYEDMIRNTSTKNAPWFVIPANKKWFARYLVSCVVVDALAKMELAYPVTNPAKKKKLAAAKRKLLRE